ncbi:ATP-binding protein [Caloramator sp. E03]|uniref:ATP-binding protein n=1 Tax=Caloramator sp. E03 TaxID=2576307 RepID=UPI0021101DDA|nr:ATP-binding protein [Caloramator sp. E03]
MCTCFNNLSYILVPIYVKKVLIAYLYIGQFFLNEPDIEYYKNQAIKYGINEEEYINAVKKIPVITKEKAEDYLKLLMEISNLISQMAEKQIKAEEALDKVKHSNKMLEMINNNLIKTEEKLFEQYNKVLESEKYKAEFFANISHEFRTPVNVIHAAIQMSKVIVDSQQNFPNKDKLIKYLDSMKQNSYRLIRLVSNLIDITKIDSNYLNLNLMNCDIVDLIKSITLSVQEYADCKDIKMYFDANENSRIIACDPHNVERVMLNLLSNAIKFNVKGGSIFVYVKSEDEKITISVRDTGVGIPKDKQAYIFDRFFQVDGNINRKNEGSGLGLSIVKSLVELHKGKIYFNSTIGIGTEFYVELPTNLQVTDENLKDEIYKFSYLDNLEKLNIEFWDIG